MSTDTQARPVTPESEAPASPAADPAPARPAFDLDRAWRLHEQVSIRPERFGALLYHFGTRQLSFLKSPALLQVVNGLAEAPTAREACARAGVAPEQLNQYGTALATLAASQMIRPA